MQTHDTNRRTTPVRLARLAVAILTVATVMLGVAGEASASTDPYGSGSSANTYIYCNNSIHTISVRTVAYFNDTTILRRVWVRPNGSSTWLRLRTTYADANYWEGVGFSGYEVLNLPAGTYSVLVEYAFQPTWSQYLPWKYTSEYPPIWQMVHGSWVRYSQCWT